MPSTKQHSSNTLCKKTALMKMGIRSGSPDREGFQIILRTRSEYPTGSSRG